MYAVDAITRRAQPLQETYDANYPHGAHMNLDVARAYSLTQGDSVAVIQNEEEVVLSVVIDDRIPAGCVYVAQGLTAHCNLGAGYEPLEIKRV
jgi:NADH-quinone oxidoreductase subunit G